MFNRYRKVIVGGVVVALLAGGAAAYAQRFGGPGPGGRRPGGPGAMMMEGLRQLGLTDAQRQQVREIGQRHRDQMRAAADQLGQALDAQRAAVQAVPLNEDLIRSTTQAVAEAQTQMALEQARMRSEIFGILTPEQQEKAKQRQSQREARMKERRDRMRQRQQ